MFQIWKGKRQNISINVNAASGQSVTIGNCVVADASGAYVACAADAVKLSGLAGSSTSATGGEFTLGFVNADTLYEADFYTNSGGTPYAMTMEGAQFALYDASTVDLTDSGAHDMVTILFAIDSEGKRVTNVSTQTATKVIVRFIPTTIIGYAAV